MDHFGAICSMGLCLMRVQPRDELLMLTGLVISDLAVDNLQELYRAQGASEELARLHRFRSA